MSRLHPAIRLYRAEKRMAEKRGANVIGTQRAKPTALQAAPKSGTPEYWRARYVIDREKILARKARQRAAKRGADQ